jgi:recombination protein RecA
MSSTREQRFPPDKTATVTGTARDRLAALRQMLPNLHLVSAASDRFLTGCEAFNNLFPGGGVPFGHLFELTGGLSSGKTGMLLFLLSAVPPTIRTVYIDASGTFYPPAAYRAGVSCERLAFMAATAEIQAALAAERVLDSGTARVVACDLTGCQQTLSTGLVHRLRMTAVRRRGLVFFLTENARSVLPPSMMSAQFTVTARRHHALTVAVTKSRLMPVGRTAEVIVT